MKDLFTIRKLIVDKLLQNWILRDVIGVKTLFLNDDHQADKDSDKSVFSSLIVNKLDRFEKLLKAAWSNMWGRRFVVKDVYEQDKGVTRKILHRSLFKVSHEGLGQAKICQELLVDK